jgi:RNA polymerase sigma-70 factor, ECF subfamily
MSILATDDQDRQDMARLVDGHAAALNELMARHAESVFHYLIRLLQDASDAEDLAQETFVRVYQKRDRFNPRQKFSTWLYTIATNLARDQIRRRMRHPHCSLEAKREETNTSLKDTLATTQPTPAETLQADERAAAVRHAVAELPEELRTPLILAEYEEHSQAEIAVILNCSAKAVEMRIYRARQHLRTRLEKLLPLIS